MSLAFDDMARLYRGEYAGYTRCDTQYHDLQHVLDVGIAHRVINPYFFGQRFQASPAELPRGGRIAPPRGAESKGIATSW